jgi:hypothetical protein
VNIRGNGGAGCASQNLIQVKMILALLCKSLMKRSGIPDHVNSIALLCGHTSQVSYCTHVLKALSPVLAQSFTAKNFTAQGIICQKNIESFEIVLLPLFYS